MYALGYVMRVCLVLGVRCMLCVCVRLFCVAGSVWVYEFVVCVICCVMLGFGVGVRHSVDGV